MKLRPIYTQLSVAYTNLSLLLSVVYTDVMGKAKKPLFTLIPAHLFNKVNRIINIINFILNYINKCITFVECKIDKWGKNFQ